MKTAIYAFVFVVVSFGLVGCGGEEEAVMEAPAGIAETAKDVSEALPAASAPASVPASMPAVEAGDAALIAMGKELCAANDCVACHSTDGSDGQGPTFKGMFAADQVVETAGFPVCCPGSLGDEEVVAVIAYIKSIP